MAWLDKGDIVFAGNNVKVATEEQGIREVLNVLKIHMNSPEVADPACASILALSLDGGC